MIDLPEICSVQELARATKSLSPRDIKDDCKAGRIAHYRRNTKIFIDRQDALEYLETLKCPRKTPDTGLNGGKKGINGKSFGSNKAGESASQRAQRTARRLINSSQNTSPRQNVVPIRGL